MSTDQNGKKTENMEGSVWSPIGVMNELDAANRTAITIGEPSRLTPAATARGVT